MTVADTETVRFRLWPLMLILGLVNVVIGIAVIVWPDITLAVLAFLLGLQVLVFGIIRLIIAFSAESKTEGRGLLFTGALFGIVVGLLIVREPLRAVEIMVTLLGVYWVMIGIIGFVFAVFDSGGSRGRQVIEALVAFTGGVVLLAWPDPTLTVLVWVAGLSLLAWGLVLAAMALAVRSESDV